MALQDFDASKIAKWRYDKVGVKDNPQTFIDGHSTVKVTGKRDKISTLINKIEANPENYANVSYTSILDKIKDGSPQMFSTDNPAGTYSITGLKGEIPGSEFEFDNIKDKSLLMSIWTNSFEFTQGLITIDSTDIPLSVKVNNPYTPSRKNNPTHGFSEISSAYKMSTVSGTQYFSFDEEPRRFGRDTGPNWTVNTLHGTDWGGSQASDMGDAYVDLTMKSKWWGNFVDKQSDLQSAYTIMKGQGQLFGSGLMVDAPFNSVDFIGMAAGFYIGTRGVRIGGFIQGAPSYLENAPLIGDESGPNSIPGNTNPFKDWKTIGSGTTSKTGGDSAMSSLFTGDPNFGEIPKLGYLYDNYIIREQGKAKSDGSFGDTITGMIVNFISNATNPYPIAPSVNVVKSGEGASNYDDNGELAKRYETHGLHQLPNHTTTGETRNLYESRLRSPYESKLFAADGVIDTISGIEFDSEKTSDQFDEMAGEDLKGTRLEGRQKVYKLGRSGLRTEGTLGSLDTKGKEDGFSGLVRLNGTGDNASYRTDQTDKVNMIPYGHRSGSDDLDYEDLDFIPLSFKDVYNDKYIVFRAMALGDITDTITPEWEETKFVGRPTAAHSYKGVGRTIGFGFKVHPMTKQEFPVLLEKVNYLTGLCYPNLDKYLRQTGPFVKLTVGDIVKEQLGYLSSLTVTFPEDSPWETDKGLKFTHRIDVECEFTYIGNNIPVSKGVHYNLDWLDGTKYDENGVAFEEFPVRSKYTELFKDLGQQK